MRFKINTSGKRIKKFFAYFPVRINSEIRWLEYVTVEQEYVDSHVSPIGEFFTSYWKNVRFLNQ